MSKKSLENITYITQANSNSKSAEFSSSITQDEELTLSHFLILPLTLNYLNPKDKIQLSEVNKSLRLRLEPLIFRKIKIFPDNYLDNRGQYGTKKNIRGIQSILLDQVIKFIGPKSCLVKEITIREAFNSKFAKIFFSTFFHIANVNIENCTVETSILKESLRPLEQLEHLYAYVCKFENHGNKSDSKIYYHLPKTIKTFKLENCSDDTNDNWVDMIDDTNTNLQRVTLINSEMFNRFQFYYPNLIELNIENIKLADNPLIKKILVDNPQITKLSISGIELIESFMNFILALKNIVSLKLDYLFKSLPDGWKLIDNSTITTIKFDKLSCRILMDLCLHSCKNLQRLQILSKILNAEYINWQRYEGSLNTIEYMDYRFTYLDDFDKYTNCLSLKKIVLRNKVGNWDQYVLDKLYKLKCWKVKKGETIILTRLN